jgi:hypothetical protein
VTTTPLWVPLVVAGLGVAATVLGTIGGVLITQRRSDKRESISWERERERERKRWGREDAARTFDHRRVAYADFYESLSAMMLRVYNHGLGLTDTVEDELPWDWQFSTFQLLQRVYLYGSTTVGVIAAEAYSAVWQWGHAARRGRDDEAFYAAQEEADQKETALLVAIRRDLAIPDQ